MKPIRPHPDHHDLHGITVAVDTVGAELYVGRCHDIDERAVYLVDVAVHVAAPGAPSKRDWLTQVARFGPFAQHARLAVPREQVKWLQRLGEIAADGPPAECQ
ncbi:MAG: hypothetical protein H6835_01455 [Planctomycetes bacterium]|nr:hypothetical protein [Planctomycetota bacterium]